MLFQSQGFILVFLPIAVACYYVVAHSERARHAVLITASLVFYGWWDARFILLLLGQIGGTWALAYAHKRTGRAAWLYAGIALNLASLATFKYLDFLLASVQKLVGVALPRADILLPIGISFFSFQLVSYLVDRLRDDAPIYPFRPFALFILFFPHLIAGPIVRHNELIPQLALDPCRAGLWRRVLTGLVLFTIGFAKKVLVADDLAKDCVNPLFHDALGRSLSFAEAWNATLGFALQIFIDFSAYTEMAIGIALLFGLLLPDNFRRPYLATDLREFWRRWHMTLSNTSATTSTSRLAAAGMAMRATSWRRWARWRCAACGTAPAGPSWSGACGTGSALWSVGSGSGSSARCPADSPRVITMLFVLAGWVVFRAADFATATAVFRSLIGLNGLGGTFQQIPLIITAILLAALLPSTHEIKDQWVRPAPARAIVLGNSPPGAS